MQINTIPESRLKPFIDNPQKSLWSLALPVMFGMGMQSLYNIVDMIFIGKLGGEEITGVALNMPLVFLMLGLTTGLGSGVTAIIARFIGENNKTMVDNAAQDALAISSIISIFFLLGGLFFGKNLLINFGAGGDILKIAWEYLFIILLGSPFLVFSSCFKSILTGEGDSKFPMLVVSFGTGLNILLDPLFIFELHGIGLGLGIEGAAMATVLSQFIVFIIFIYKFFIKDNSYITFRIKDYTPSYKIIWEIINIGVPASLSMLIMAFGQGIFNKILIIYPKGYEYVAGYQVAGRIDLLIFLPILSIASALTIIVSMFYGAKKYSELLSIIKYGLGITFIITSIFSLIVFVYALEISGLFTNNEDIKYVSVSFLRHLTLIYPFVALAIISGNILQGIGKGLPILVITIVRVLGLGVPLAIYFSYYLNKPLEWNWYAMMISGCTAIIIALYWLRIELNKL